MAEAPALAPPEVQIDIAAQQQDEAELPQLFDFSMHGAEFDPFDEAELQLLMLGAEVEWDEAFWQFVWVHYAATQPLPDDDDDAFE